LQVVDDAEGFWGTIMKALISKRSIIIASISLIIAIIAIISVTVFNSAGPITGFADTVTRPVRALASTIARTFGNIYASIYRYEELERRNDELARTIARLQADSREATELALENEQLRDLLEFRERYGGYDNEMASLVSWNSDNWSHSFVINKGYSNSNIARGMGVTTEYGVLLGQVWDVGATRSTVITVLDTRFSAAVFIGGDTSENSDGTATVKGDFNQMRSELLMLDHIDDDMVVNPGSSVVTSGSGGVFPAGLTVGEIVTVSGHASGLGRYATVRPLRDINTIQTVFVIVAFEYLE